MDFREGDRVEAIQDISIWEGIHRAHRGTVDHDGRLFGAGNIIVRWDGKSGTMGVRPEDIRRI